jgi:hypothetical protein
MNQKTPEQFGPALPPPLNTKDWSLRAESMYERGADRMPLLGQKLFSSDFFALCSAEAFRVATRLWWCAWNECPAGSLPSSDTHLCLLAGYGQQVRRWAKVRDEALHGFVLCNDGNYYHPLIVELAKEEFATSPRFRKRRKLLLAKRAGSAVNQSNVTNLNDRRRG